MTEFDDLYARAQVSVRDHDDATMYEPDLLNVLEYIKQHPSDTAHVKAIFCRDIEEGTRIPFQLIGYCMHELRWPEVLAAAVRRKAREAGNPHGRRLAELIIEAYNDDWDCHLMFDYYRANDNHTNQKTQARRFDNNGAV